MIISQFFTLTTVLNVLFEKVTAIRLPFDPVHVDFLELPGEEWVTINFMEKNFELCAFRIYGFIVLHRQIMYVLTRF